LHWERRATFARKRKEEENRNMGAIAKFTDNNVRNLIRHYRREIKNDRNTDIDQTRTHLNYCLTPKRELTEWQYYKQRKKEVFCYNRSDVKTVADFVITAPKELSSIEEIKEFFSCTNEFLLERYGSENCILSVAHFDEGKQATLKDRFGNNILNPDGTPKKFIEYGRPHLHFLFMPITADHNPKHPTTEKICCKEILTKAELQRFHPQLRQFLRDRHCPGADGVLNGSTKKYGRNRTVAELKENFERDQELKRLRELVATYEQERGRSREGHGRW
jgi:hypothetical protein